MQFDPAILKALQVSLSEDRKHIVIRSDRRHTNADNFSFGIEEEYFLADAGSLEAALRTPDELFEAVNWSTGGQSTRELLQAQLEVGTNVHSHATDAFEELKFLRKEVGKIAAQYGFAIMACGTHPTAAWDESVHSPKLRYTEMMDDLRMLGQRNMLCGMHVHVQLPDPDQRFQIMCDMIPYIPLFIALSTSSPFWHSQETGLKGYRLAAYDELPRTGLPELLCTKEHMTISSRLWSIPEQCRTPLTSGGPCGHRCGILRWSCARQTVAPACRTPSRSPAFTESWSDTSV